MLSTVTIKAIAAHAQRKKRRATVSSANALQNSFLRYPFTNLPPYSAMIVYYITAIIKEQQESFAIFRGKNFKIESRYTGNSSPGSAFNSSPASSPRSSCQNAALPIIAALSVQSLSGGI